MVIPVFIGYDSREKTPYKVACDSLRHHSSVPVFIQPLILGNLQATSIYRRTHIFRNNEYLDEEYDETHTTEFTYSRYLVPALTQWQGWAIYCDCDFLFRADIGELWSHRDENHAVHVAKHTHQHGADVKMWGIKQKYYARKNWSSLMLINCEHDAMRYLTPYRVNHAPREWLHGLSWLDDSEIGELPVEWNYLEGITNPAYNAKAVHYTLGTPDLEGYEQSRYADEWRSYL